MIFAQPLSYDGGEVSVVRITDVQADRFTLYVDEAPNHGSGAHTTETVSWLVLEAGSWTLPDGTRLEVGTVATAATVGKNVNNSWESITFSEAFGATPVVLGQVQTENDAHWVKTRQRNNSASGFQVALEEDEAQTTTHGEEVIGWLAIEAGQGTWNGHAYEAGKTGDTVTHNWYTTPFGQSFSQAPRVLASLASYDGGDNAHLRRKLATTTGVQVKVEEDTTYDSEMNHTTEDVDYLVVQGDGTLTAQGGGIVTKYYHFSGQRVAMRKEGVVYYLAGDHLGTTSLVLCGTAAGCDGVAEGDVVAESRHYPYGEERWRSGTLPTDYRFTGQREDGYIKLYQMGARWYDSELGRWISPDTLIPDPANPQSLNRYSYVYNNPLGYIDSSGHAPWQANYLLWKVGLNILSSEAAQHFAHGRQDVKENFSSIIGISAVFGASPLVVAASIAHQASDVERAFGTDVIEGIALYFKPNQSVGIAQLRPWEHWAWSSGASPDPNDLGYVGAVKGNRLSLNPTAAVLGMSHKIAMQDYALGQLSAHGLSMSQTDRFMLLAIGQNCSRWSQFTNIVSAFGQHQGNWSNMLSVEPNGYAWQKQLRFILLHIEWLLENGMALPEGLDLDYWRRIAFEGDVWPEEGGE